MKSFVQYVSRQFGHPAGFGGFLSTFVMNRLNGKQYQAVMDNIHIQPNDLILDVGFGNGYLIGKLLKRRPKQIFGIDISADMLATVSRKYQSAIQSGNVGLCLANVKELPFEDACFNKIYTVNTLYFWDDTKNSFSEIKRTLSPQGLFLNVIYTREWLDKVAYTRYGFSKYSVEQIIEMTEESGLKVIQTIEIQPQTSFCIIAQKQE